MLDPAHAADLAVALVAAARAAGADAADASASASADLSVSVRLGALEDVERSEQESFALRVFVGQRSASVSASRLGPGAARDLAERAVAMAREAPEDDYAGLAPADRLLQAPVPDLDLYDPAAPDPASLRQAALAAEDAARAVAGVTNSEGAGAQHGVGVTAYATSTGFVGGHRASSHMLSTSVLAGEGSGQQRDHDWRSARHRADLPDADAIGRSAGERAVARLNPVSPDSGVMPILFDARVSASLLGHLLGAIAGPAIARGTSFLRDALGERLFAPGVTVIDDPLLRRGLGSRPFDGEGLPTGRLALIDDGVLTGWLVDSASGRQLGLPPTGHASGGGGVRASNLTLVPGNADPAALMADIRLGICVTELIGQGVNGVTGDYSRGAAGFLIRDGALAEPVAEFTIAGNLRAMFAQLTPANDLAMIRAANAPTVRIDGMTVAGNG